MRITTTLRAAALAACPLIVSAAEAPAPDPGHTAWLMTATALVLLMTLPGLALFYGGLVRSKNVLSVLVQCFTLAGAMSLLWVIVGYSLAFSDGGALNDWIGGFEHLFLNGVTREAVSGETPLSVFVLFQGTFFIITPALICGAFAERMKFSAMLLFSLLWGLTCYLPICHMAWGGGLFHHWGVMDFAGGTVVHINAGIAALVAALVIGPRMGYPQQPIKPHNMTMTVTGAAMLWVGWFGFNAGSALAADGSAGMAMLVTHIAAAAGAMSWAGIEACKDRRASALGVVSGAVAGLVAITPAAGNVGPMGAIALGALSGTACYWSVAVLKIRLGYDDSLDAFGVHGIGGIVGAVLTGLFAMPLLGGTFGAAEVDATATWSTAGVQVWWQFASVLVTLVWSGVLSFVLLKLIGTITGGLRVSDEHEQTGLDLTQHEEQGYIMS